MHSDTAYGIVTGDQFIKSGQDRDRLQQECNTLNAKTAGRPYSVIPINVTWTDPLSLRSDSGLRYGALAKPTTLEQLCAKYPFIEGESVKDRIDRRYKAALEGFDLEAQELCTPGMEHYHQGTHCHCRY